ncbi:dienelactone hydrolase family protein [Antrihabitans cavernicola]|uniref:Dienelactone hydrolase family protein n=1 Tax=Antrihabitans cavernicola TaxID=2495913 RepID=A0A5A7S9H5_9NOCA|nr:dienelactone hydrolase family protein [Spelaeibacter cavernicola]KAA0022828.1 dienelactone hydrolase family protein [Spelaeibacter cavernicola]
MTTPLTTVPAEGAVRGGIVVLQEAFGITDHIVDVCNRFAAAGWTAVAPHLFHRKGDPILAYDDLETALRLVHSLVGTELDEDVDAALASLASAGIEAQNTAVVGYCMGGSVAFHTAVRRSLGAAITYYGGGITNGRFGYPAMVDEVAELQTPWLGHFGDIDKGIPVDQVEALRAATDSTRTDTAIDRYATADHGFNCNDRPAVFNEAASALAWTRTFDWMEGHRPQQ